MTDLARENCEPCTQASPAVAEAEWQGLLGALPGWAVQRESGIPVLTREFGFRDFAAALDFANRVGTLAEAEDHHPRLVVEYGRVSVSWWTHAIGGLHRNDFILAARTDRLLDG
jgi:4a-hydroxytetrahydrobiopterin dehydratase